MDLQSAVAFLVNELDAGKGSLPLLTSSASLMPLYEYAGRKGVGLGVAIVGFDKSGRPSDVANAKHFAFQQTAHMVATLSSMVYESSIW